MLSTLFIHLLNMSITAGWIVLAILLLRPFMKKVPRTIFSLLWVLVALRLIVPISFESVLSLIPSSETVPPEIMYTDKPMVHTGISAVNSSVNPILNETMAPTFGESVNPLQIVTAVASAIWLVGMISMLLYTLIAYLRLYRKVKISLKLEKGIYLCDTIDSPFILGVFRPKIYLPSTLTEEQKSQVLSHEKAHLKRRDHLWKPFGFLLLMIYWFNPLLWVAYILLCRDIELACDEHVIKDMTEEEKKRYSEVLLTCSISRHAITACPLAFGEVGVKSRIRSILHYKKPAFWIIVISLIICLVATVCFLTDPLSESTPSLLYDIDNDGIEERFTVGGTLGYGFIHRAIYAYENDELEYSGWFSDAFDHYGFLLDENGKLQLRYELIQNGKTTVYHSNIVLKDNRLCFDGEILLSERNLPDDFQCVAYLPDTETYYLLQEEKARSLYRLVKTTFFIDSVSTDSSSDASTPSEPNIQLFFQSGEIYLPNITPENRNVGLFGYYGINENDTSEFSFSLEEKPISTTLPDGIFKQISDILSKHFPLSVVGFVSSHHPFCVVYLSKFDIEFIVTGEKQSL